MPDLVTLAEVRGYLFPAGAPDNADRILGNLISVVSAAVEQETQVSFSQQVYGPEYLDGSGRPSIFLSRAPILPAPLPVVKENGIALTVAVGYSVTADVILRPDYGILYRQAGLTPPTISFVGSKAVWPKGTQNIEVTSFTAGYAVVPEDLKSYVKYAVAFLWEMPDRKRIGVRRRGSGGQGDTEFLDDLPAVYKRILAQYTRRFLG